MAAAPRLGDPMQTSTPSYIAGAPEPNTFRLLDARIKEIQRYLENGEQLAEIEAQLAALAAQLAALMGGTLQTTIVDSEGNIVVANDPSGSPGLRVFSPRLEELLDQLVLVMREQREAEEERRTPDVRGHKTAPKGVPFSTTAVTFVRENRARTSVSIANSSDAGTGTLYVLVQSGSMASISRGGYTVPIAAGGYWEIPYPGCMAEISGIWAAGTTAGYANVTEFVE